MHVIYHLPYFNHSTGRCTSQNLLECAAIAVQLYVAFHVKFYLISCKELANISKRAPYPARLHHPAHL